MVFSCGYFSSFRQDSVWSWFICCCSTICMILTIGFAFSLGVLFPVLMDSFNETRERTAWTTSIIIGVFSFLGPFMGAFVNRFGIRISAILGCLSCSAGLAMGSFVPSIVTLYIAFSLPFAVGSSFIFVTATMVPTHYFTKRRSIALGLVMAGQGLGTMILGPTLQALADVFDWRNTFRMFAGLLGFASFSGFFLHHETSSPSEEREDPSKKFTLNLSLLRTPVLPILMLARAGYGFCRTVPYVHLIKHCDDLGISAKKSSTLFLFLGICSTLGRLGGGFLCDVSKRIKARFIFQSAAFIMGVSTMVLPLAQTYGVLAAYAIVFGVVDGMMMVTFIIELFNSMEESKKASALGFTLMCSGAFATGSPPLSGFMADKFGNYTSAFLMAGAAGIIASLVPFSLFCVKRESEENRSDHDIEEASEEPGQGRGNVAGRGLHLLQQSGEDGLQLTNNAIMVNKADQGQASPILLMESSI